MDTSIKIEYINNSEPISYEVEKAATNDIGYMELPKLVPIQRNESYKSETISETFMDSVLVAVPEREQLGVKFEVSNNINAKAQEWVIIEEAAANVIQLAPSIKDIYQKKSRNGRISAAQRAALFDFVRRHQELINTKFTSEFRPRHAQALWQALTEKLNFIAGAKKNWKQWKKTWQDFHSKTKIKSCRIAKHKRLAGSGKALKETLTPVEKDILDIICLVKPERRVDFVRPEAKVVSVSEPLVETKMCAKKSRIGRISIAQRTALLEFIKKHRELINTKFTPTFRPKHARALWETLTERLNSIPGAKKNWKRWRKTWHDYHSNVKKKSCHIDSHKQTGESEALSDSLTSVEEDILDIISVAEVEVSTSKIELQNAEINNCENSFQEPDSSLKPPATGHLSAVQSSNMFIVNDAGSYRLPVNHTPLALSSDKILLEPHQKKPSKLKATVAQPTRQRMLESPQIKPPKFKIRQKRNLAAQHLHHITAAKKLTATIHKENMLKQSYYKEKLKILQEQATAMSRIATALERLSNK